MNFRDQWAEDSDGKRYVFSVEMQRLLFEKGLPLTSDEWLKFKKTYAPPSAPRRDDRRQQRNTPPHRTEITEREVDEATGKFIGILKNFNRQKGFGFIDMGGNNDIYFNKKKALDDPYAMRPGQKVIYKIDTFRGKDEAIDVEEYLE